MWCQISKFNLYIYCTDANDLKWSDHISAFELYTACLMVIVHRVKSSNKHVWVLYLTYWWRMFMGMKWSKIIFIEFMLMYFNDRDWNKWLFFKRCQRLWLLKNIFLMKLNIFISKHSSVSMNWKMFLFKCG